MQSDKFLSGILFLFVFFFLNDIWKTQIMYKTLSYYRNTSTYMDLPLYKWLTD